MNGATAPPALVQMARNAAAQYTLDAALVCAIVEQESSWDTWSIRYEPLFFAKYVAPQFTASKIDVTEAYARGISWGLMQVMGEVAREFGFTGKLSSLCLAANGLDIGCKVFAHKLAVNQGSVRDALKAWNGGANQNYADEVMARMTNYQTAQTT